MKKTIFSVLILLYSMISLTAFTQEKSQFKFGSITEKDFEPKVYAVDSNASAVVLADIGSTEFVGNNNGWFSLEFKHFKRVHILNKNGYDIANVSIPLYKNGTLEEEIKGLKVSTYNLENGKVVEARLEKANLFKEKVSKKLVLQKFAFPNVKEGSIIEYEYVLKSDFLFNLQPWEFQGSYPRLWSEYSVSMPEFFVYMFQGQGYVPFFIKESKDRSDNFTIIESNGTGASETYRFRAGVTDHRWVVKDVPALKEESFTSSVSNHISKVSFQLAEFREPLTPRKVMGSWSQAFEELLKDEEFGASLSTNNGWLGEYVSPLINGVNSPIEKAKRIFYFVSSGFTCTNHEGIYLQRPLKTIAKEKNGSVAELNLLLIAMLRYAGLTADPVLLSTRSNGVVYPFYPMISKFNYVLCHTSIEEKSIYLDASWPLLGFGKLLPECYNGHARLVTPRAEALEFPAESLMERSATSVRLHIDEKGGMVGYFNQVAGDYESFDIRKRWKENGEETFRQQIKKTYGEESTVSDLKIDSLDQKEQNVVVNYKFEMKGEGEDIIYLSAMFGEAWKENPFKSANRYYPVEMPYIINETYAVSVMLPDNYIVEEMPKSVVVKFENQADGGFEYRIMQSGNVISMRTKVMINRANFDPQEYEFLREFFSYVVKKQAEQIVLKKKF